MELGPLLEEFERYAKNSYIANIKLGVPDIKEFLLQFFTRRTFFINGIMYYGASSKLDGEPRFVFTEPDYTTDDYIEAVLPELIQLYTNAYGAPSDTPFSKEWSPKPFKAETEREKQQAAIMKERIMEYNQRTLPFRLSKTMYHPISTVWFSSSSGTVGTKGKVGEVTITSQEEIEEFIDSTSFYSLVGGKDASLRDLWFEALNDEKSNPKFGWFDIDNPADLSEKEHKEVVSKISKMLSEADRKHIIMFTGRNYQIWFAPKKGERFDYAMDVKTIVEGYGAKAGALVGNGTAYRNKAVANGKIWVDTGVYKKNQKLGFFFGMHFKPGRLEDSTGLVRVPVKRSELSAFDPLVDAHPENVLLRFDELKARVDMFCQEVELGEGFPYKDRGYPCYRSARGNNDTKNPLAKRLEEWKKPKMKEFSKSVAGEEVLQHESITVMPKLDGWLGGMAFNISGGFKVNGQDLDGLQEIEGMIQSIQTEKQRALMCTKGGIFSWDSYLTHAFENACRSIGVTEAIVTGEIVTYNDLGKVAGREGVASVLNRQEAEPVNKVSTHDTHDFRKLKFVIHDVLSLDGSDVSRDIPIAQRLALFSEVSNDRISVIPHEVVTEDLFTNFEALWKKHVQEEQNEGLVVYGGGKRYKIKRRYTLDAAIIGIDTDAKHWQDQKEMLSTVIVAVSKNTGKGPTFFAFQRIGNFRLPDEVRKDLFHKVLGDRKNEEWSRNSFANVLPYENKQNPNIYWVDPKVVVEIEYESLGNETKPAFMFYREQVQKSTADSRSLERGYRLSPIVKPAASRRLKGPPVILSERMDKSTFNPVDISHEQAEGAGGLQISSKVTKIASEELENPSKIKVTHVRTNPMYGYARGPRWIAGGGMSESSPTEAFRLGTHKGPGHISFDDVKLTMEQEFIEPLRDVPGATTRGKSGWQPNYKPIWDQARQHPQTGVNFYPEMTGMAFSSADAIFDERGPNIPGGRKGIIESQSSKYSLKRLLSDEYHHGGEQLEEDAKQLGRALGKELLHAPKASNDASDMLYQLVEKDISEADKIKEIDSKMGSKNFSSSKGFSKLERSPVRSNPASSNSRWNQRTKEYRKEYQEWLKEPEPKQSWKAHALKRYEAWEIPLLEKGRQFMDAEDNFLYSDSEEAIIHGRFPSLDGEDEGHIFSVITLGDDDDEFES